MVFFLAQQEDHGFRNFVNFVKPKRTKIGDVLRVKRQSTFI